MTVTFAGVLAYAKDVDFLRRRRRQYMVAAGVSRRRL